MDSPEALLPEKSYYTRDGRNLLGPFSRAELALQLQQRKLRPDDLVQMEGLPLWQPVRVVLEEDAEAEPTAEAELPPDGETPEWPVLFRLLGRRLRHEFESPSVTAAALCLALGTLALLLLRAPVLFWLPWFGGALLVAVLFLLQRQLLPGVLLLLGALAIPYLLLPSTEPAPLAAARPEAPTNPVPAPAVAQAPTPAVPPPVTPAPPPVSAAPVVAAAPTPAPDLVSKPAPVAPAPTAVPSISPVARPLAQAPPAVSAVLPPTARPVVTEPAMPLVRATPAVARHAPFPLNNPALPTPSIPTPPTLRTDSGADFVQAHGAALVLIKGANGSGSGFIATQGGQPYLFTNIHVAAEVKRPEFTLLDGTRLQPVSAEAAAGHDIMRFQLSGPPRQAIPANSDMGNQVRVGDAVFVPGNSGGGGVVTNLPGKVVGIGPDRIEVSSEFIPGNSGSPIIHASTGEVIGIATYLIRRHDELAKPGTGDATADDSVTIRRFGYRLDSVRSWEPVNWNVFRSEAEQLHQVSELSEDIVNFLYALRSKRVPSFTTETLRRPATEWRQKLTQPRLSAADRTQATQSFLYALRSMAHSDVAALQGRIRYSYFRDELERETEVRDRLFKAFDKESVQLASPSMGGY